jgi:hypothetical protein
MTFSRNKVNPYFRPVSHLIDIPELGTATLHFESVAPVEQAEVRIAQLLVFVSCLTINYS